MKSASYFAKKKVRKKNTQILFSESFSVVVRGEQSFLRIHENLGFSSRMRAS